MDNKSKHEQWLTVFKWLLILFVLCLFVLLAWTSFEPNAPIYYPYGLEGN